MSVLAPPSRDVLATVTRARRQRSSRRRRVVGGLAAATVVLYVVSLLVGQTYYSPVEVLRVVRGQEVDGASFTVGVLRLPRASLAVAAGASFGLGGVAFQTMLRNPLASPDIIGISTGASAAAALGIVVWGLSGTAVSVVAIVAALGVSLVIYLLAYRDGVAGARLVLIGIGVAAMLNSLIQWVLLQAGAWDYAQVLRWLTGSLNGTTWGEVRTSLAALLVLGPALLLLTRDLDTLLLGDDTASAVGVPVERTRLLVIVAAVGLVAFSTAAAGPVAFVAFLSGPIAARILGPHGSVLLPAGLVGAVLVLSADLVGQYLLGTRFPVGVVTGVLGAPYLVYLIVRSNRVGGSL